MTSLWVPGSDSVDDADERVKTVFATYGLAMYQAALLEVELVHAFALHKIIDAKSAAKLIADPWHSGYKKKLFELIRHVEGQSPSDPDLVEDLTECRKRRNWLAHSYWREHDLHFVSPSGQTEMIRNLDADVEFIQGVRARLSTVVHEPAHQDLGFTQGMFDAEFRRLYSEAGGE
ncbi:hypothetical protein ACN6LM_002644 [Streptomyces sp. SAS_281]|uniref:hypothetical protein n=1 Tax=Streptomyces sp. SAS_281 TaxID=3412744 RepID=UPI00403C32C3